MDGFNTKLRVLFVEVRIEFIEFLYLIHRWSRWVKFGKYEVIRRVNFFVVIQRFAINGPALPEKTDVRRARVFRRVCACTATEGLIWRKAEYS